MGDIRISDIKDINTLAFMRDIMEPTSSEWQEAEKKIRDILSEKYNGEMAYCIETSMMPSCIKEGFTPSHETGSLYEKIDEYGAFISRSKAEYNPMFKQIIPYVVAITEDQEVFAMRRIKGDARLVGQASIGIGGHIDQVDDQAECVVTAGLLRELHEEVNVDDEDIKSIKYVGTIYDPSNKVGQDHLGFMFLLRLKNKEMTIKETETLKGGFYSINRLKEMTDEDVVLETWSQIALDNMIER